MKPFLAALLGSLVIALSACSDSITPSIDNFYSGIKTFITTQAKADFGAPFKSTLTAEDVRTIGGNSEEGVWSWINLNDHYCRYFKVLGLGQDLARRSMAAQ